MIKLALAIGAVLPFSFPTVCAAQDAAETAIILSGSGNAQARAQRSMGSAVAGSIGNAANVLAAVNAGTSAGQGSASVPRSSPQMRQSMMAVPRSGDPLAGTNAPTYRLGNGASIRVSGGMIPAGKSTCVKNCGNR